MTRSTELYIEWLESQQTIARDECQQLTEGALAKQAECIDILQACSAAKLRWHGLADLKREAIARSKNSVDLADDTLRQSEIEKRNGPPQQ